MRRLLNSIRQKLFSSGNDFPVKINFGRGRSGSDLFLRHHPEAEIQFIRRGRGAYYINDRRYPFARNTVLVIKPNLKHRYMHWTGQYIEKITLMFSANLAGDRRLVSSLPVCVRLPDREAAGAEQILHSIREEHSAREKYWREAIRNNIKLYLILLGRVGGKRSCLPPANNPMIDRVQDYIDAHYNQPVSVGMLAGMFHISPSHLAHLFKKCMNTGIKQYILWRRILEAKTILASNPSIKAVELARMVGFKDYALFHRCFGRDTGMNLSAYRGVLRKKPDKVR